MSPSGKPADDALTGALDLENTPVWRGLLAPLWGGKSVEKAKNVGDLAPISSYIGPRVVEEMLGTAANPRNIKYFTSALNKIVNKFKPANEKIPAYLRKSEAAISGPDLENQAIQTFLERMRAGDVPEKALGQVNKAVGTYAQEQGGTVPVPPELRRLKSLAEKIQQVYASRTPFPRTGGPPEMKFEDLLAAVRQKRGLSVSPEQLKAAMSSGAGKRDISEVTQAGEIMKQLFPGAKFSEDQISTAANLVDKLPPRMRAIIQGTYGTNVEPIPQKDMMKEFGLSQGRISALRNEAIERLKKMWPGEVPMAQPAEHESGDVSKRVYEWLKSRKGSDLSRDIPAGRGE